MEAVDKTFAGFFEERKDWFRWLLRSKQHKIFNTHYFQPVFVVVNILVSCIFISYFMSIFVFTVLYCNTKSGNLMAKSNPATMTLMPFWIQMLQKDIDSLPERIKISECGMKSGLGTLSVLTAFHNRFLKANYSAF